DLVVFIIMVLIVLFVQIMIPELLISALLPTFSLIVLYMTFENPSYSNLEHYNREMVTAFIAARTKVEKFYQQQI
ncbi:MAG: hypothetical protein K6B67_09540, partial [Lachnospiraceae bacterium]|nr:hypothetical protein [Lachnospiraceae bacterium]